MRGGSWLHGSRDTGASRASSGSSPAVTCLCLCFPHWPVREKKDLPLGPEDPKEEDGSFDYRCAVAWPPGGRGLSSPPRGGSAWLGAPRPLPHTRSLREQHRTVPLPEAESPSPLQGVSQLCTTWAPRRGAAAGPAPATGSRLENWPAPGAPSSLSCVSRVARAGREASTPHPPGLGGSGLGPDALSLSGQ